jgi:hypothetical protein
MLEKDLSLKFVCPICAAPSREQCHVQKGVLRDESHSERVELANDAVLDSIGEAHESPHRAHVLTNKSEMS